MKRQKSFPLRTHKYDDPTVLRWKGTTYGAVKADTLQFICQVIQYPWYQNQDNNMSLDFCGWTLFKLNRKRHPWAFKVLKN